MQKAQPGNSCPEPSWLPEQCIGAGRLKSKKVWEGLTPAEVTDATVCHVASLTTVGAGVQVFDECQQYFEETGFSLELLAACGILTKDTP